MRATLPEARLTASGNWAPMAAQADGGSPGQRRTALQFRLDVQDSGALLTRFGREGLVRGGRGRLDGSIGWLGTPFSIDLPTLAGQMKLDVERGQFLKADPGAGRLLGVLSLQGDFAKHREALEAIGAEPRRVSLPGDLEGLGALILPGGESTTMLRLIEATGLRAAEVTPDLETNRAAAVGEVPVERVADLTVDRVPDDGQRTVLPEGPVTCRYCRNVQASGSLCDRCGMRLPQVSLGQVVGGLLLDAEDVKVRCRACGAPATAGKKCSDCGSDVPFPDA